MTHVYLIITQILSKIKKISALWHIFPLIVTCQQILTIKILITIIVTHVVMLTILVMIYLAIVILKEKEKIIEKIMEILLIK